MMMILKCVKYQYLMYILGKTFRKNSKLGTFSIK